MNLETFFKRHASICMEEKNRTIPHVQTIILYELWKSNTPISLSDIWYEYDLEGYIVSRNAQMLSNGLKYTGTVRKGKKWITEYGYGRNKTIGLTLRGKIIAKRLFAS